MRASLEVADVFRAAGPAYRTAHAGHLSLHQLKIMSAIEHFLEGATGEPVPWLTTVRKSKNDRPVIVNSWSER